MLVHKRIILFAWLTLFLHFSLWPDECSSVTLNVPKEYATIQAGIDAAIDGDTVLVASGTYRGTGNKNLDFHGKTISVKSDAGPYNTVIDCEKKGRGIIFVKGEGAAAQFIGFSIINGFVDSSSYYGGKGGGIHCYNSSPSISDCIVKNCTASGYGGGGLWLLASSAKIEHSLFEHNSAEDVGGGIAIIDSSPVIDNSIIIRNTTTGYSSGGGIAVVRSHPTLTYLTISYNDSNTNFPYQEGKVTNSGGISFRDGSTGRLESSIISHNAAQERGGLGCWNSSPIITNCLIMNNKATIYGGGGLGLYNNSNSKISNCTIADNSAREYGGGISVWNETASDSGPSVIDSVIENNNGGESGGGMNFFNSSSLISRCIIRSNIATTRAGIGFKAVNGTTTSILVNTLVHNNVATEFGGGITCFNDANAFITNCTIVNNRSASGSAGEYSYSGGVYIFQADVTIANSILWDNQPLDSLVTNAEITYSDVSGGYNGTGNINTDPMFSSVANFRLCSNSPCINTGDNNAPNAPSVDLGGNARNQGPVDMGAYEYPYISGQPGASDKIGASIDWYIPTISSIGTIPVMLYQLLLAH